MMSNFDPQTSYIVLQFLKIDSPWITLKWYNSSVIVTGVQGELFQWNFELTSKRNMGGIIKSDGNSSPDFLDLHREHSKNTFCIGVFDDLIFTIGYDRYGNTGCGVFKGGMQN